MIQQNIPDITSGLWIMTFVLFSFFLVWAKMGIDIDHSYASDRRNYRVYFHEF
jgi:hypothetical protein